MSLKPDLIASLRAMLSDKTSARMTEDDARHAAALAAFQAAQAAEDADVAAERAIEDAPILEAIAAITAYAPDGMDFQPAAA